MGASYPKGVGGAHVGELARGGEVVLSQLGVTACHSDVASRVASLSQVVSQVCRKLWRERDGFRDSEGSYLATKIYRGVWLSDNPLDCNEGASEGPLLRVSLGVPLDEYEWIEERKPYREWLVPASLMNEHARIERVSQAKTKKTST